MVVRESGELVDFKALEKAYNEALCVPIMKN